MHALLTLALLAPLVTPQDPFDARAFKGAFAPAKQPQHVEGERRRALDDLRRTSDPKNAKLVLNAATQLADEVAALEGNRESSLLKGNDPADHDTRRRDLDADRKLEEQLLEVIAALADGPLVDALISESLTARKTPAALRLALARRSATRDSAQTELTKMLESGRRLDELAPALVAAAKGGHAYRDRYDAILQHLHSDIPLVRRLAIRALVALQVGDVLPVLVTALDDTRENVRRELAHGLEALTGQSFGTRQEAWRAWLEKEGGPLVTGAQPLTQQDREAQPKQPRSGSADAPKYHGLPLEGEHLVFIVDRSLSMEWSLTRNEQLPESGEPSRWERAIGELKEALRNLRSTQTFSIVTFAQTTEVYSPKLLAVTDKSIARAYEWLDNSTLGQFTNIHDALELSFTFTGRLPGDELFSSAVDTIYLLTDGEPTVPSGRRGRRDDPDTILRAVRRWNLLQQVTIHVIGLGDQAPAAFLERLADENGGGFVREGS